MQCFPQHQSLLFYLYSGKLVIVWYITVSVEVQYIVAEEQEIR